MIKPRNWIPKAYAQYKIMAKILLGPLQMQQFEILFP